MGGLLLGTDLGKGKKGSDVRDTAGEEQEVLNHQFAEGTRWRTTQQVLEFQAWVVGDRDILRKSRIFGEDDTFGFRYVSFRYIGTFRWTYQAGMQDCEGNSWIRK